MSWLDQPRTLEIANAALPKWQDECLFTVSRLTGTEKLGRLYDYTVEIATKDDIGLSEDLEGPTTNSVVTDDTPGKLQVQVASDHAASRLVLGSNTRIDRREGRSDGLRGASR